MKPRHYIPILFLLALGYMSFANTPAHPPVTNSRKAITEEQKTRMVEIERRVDEIRNLKKSSLTSAERKELRKELRELRKEASGIQGVYLSVGAIIIIILLLILIL